MKLMAYCGLDCSCCPAYIATQNNDSKLLAKTAARWSKQFGQEIKPENILCDGCATPSSRKNNFCNFCKIKACCLEKAYENCVLCEEYSCQKLKEFFQHAPEAKESLEKIRLKKKRL